MVVRGSKSVPQALLTPSCIRFVIVSNNTDQTARVIDIIQQLDSQEEGR